MNRWTLQGRVLHFDGKPFVYIEKEEGARPVEADGAARLIAELFNLKNVTPDSIYKQHMGRPRRAQRGAREAPRPHQRVRAPTRLDSFTRQYMETALWSSTDESRDDGGDPLDKNYSIDDIAPETRAKMIADCADFQERFGDVIVAGGADFERAGHDFWLTRNGHGAGFWDGDWPEPQATELTNASKEYGEFYLYVGDDGEIHGS